MSSTTGSTNQSTTGLFYQVSRGAIHEVAKTGSAKLVLAYLALRYHQQRNKEPKSSIELVSAGKRVICKTLGETDHYARGLLNQLREIRWGDKQEQCALVDVEAWNQGRKPEEQMKEGGYGANKMMPAYADDYISLPNHLNDIHTGQTYSPLGQIYNEIDKPLRLTAIMLLLGLYEHLDMKNYGGADPKKTMSFFWRREGEVTFDDIPLIELGSLGQSSDGLYFWAADTRSKDTDDWNDRAVSANESFIESVTKKSGEVGKSTFYKAWWALQGKGLVFHAAMVFDCHPQEDPEAEVLYPLWLFNRSERERLGAGGGLAKVTANCASRNNLIESDEIFMSLSSKSDGMIETPTGFYIFAAESPEADVVGIARPRFIPNNQDAQLGWAVNQKKAAQWEVRLNRSSRA
jgi:hypothetical protein